MISRHFTDKILKTIQGSIRAFVYPAGITVIDEPRVKIVIQRLMQQMMDHAVAYRGFMDAAWLRVGNIEDLIVTVTVSFDD